MNCRLKERAFELDSTLSKQDKKSLNPLCTRGSGYKMNQKRGTGLLKSNGPDARFSLERECIRNNRWSHRMWYSCDRFRYGPSSCFHTLYRNPLCNPAV